jgi:hypothetical protein
MLGNKKSSNNKVAGDENKGKKIMSDVKEFVDYVCNFYEEGKGLYAEDFTEAPVSREEIINTTFFMIELNIKGLYPEVCWDTADREFIRRVIEAKRNTDWTEKLIEEQKIIGYSNGVRINTAIVEYAKLNPIRTENNQ